MTISDVQRWMAELAFAAYADLKIGATDFASLRNFVLLGTTTMLVGCAQERVDLQMEILCERDGGIKIYERNPLPDSQLDRDGNPAFFPTWNESGNGFRFIGSHERIKTGNPSLSKFIFEVIRESDNKILGRYITYLRIGGAVLPRLGPDPAKRCPAELDSNQLLNMVFNNKQK